MATAISRIQIPRQSGMCPCVCGSCTCGCHHCPGISEKIPFQGLSSYRVQYTPKNSEHQRPYVPSKVAIVTPTPCNHFITTNQQYSLGLADLNRHEKSNPIRPENTLQQTNGIFSSVTTQRNDYPAYDVQPRRVASAQPRRAMEPLPGFGVYETTNTAMQGPVAAMMRSGIRRPAPTVQQVTLVRSGAPLDGSTTYKEYFPPKKSVYERLFHARQQPRANSDAMIDDRDFKTTKSLHYPVPAPGARLSSMCPSAPFAKRPASSDGHISMRY
jgi:hypothetical protein